MLRDFNKPIFGKYQMLKILGRGSFGSVFKGINKITKENVAIKIEDWKKVGNILESEAYFLFYLKNYGIPEIKAFGTYKKYKVLVQTLLGDNFEHIFANKTTNFNYKDICMIAIQLIDRLEYIHSKYVIHRDLKPENLMLDLETKKTVYLIDFGMAKKYRSSKTRKHIKFNIPNRLTGTARYCSINALRGTEQSRRDDLESAGYVLIYLAQRGYLPWMGLNIAEKIERYRRIYQIKKTIKEEDLCHYLPNEFAQYIKYTKKLKFEEDPDYNYLRGLFKQLLIKSKSQYDLKFSWIIKSKKTQKEEENLINQRNNNFFKRKETPKQRLLRNIQNSHERENKIDNLNQEKIINIIEEKQEIRDKKMIEKNNKRENQELSLKNNSDNIQGSPSFAPIKKDEYSEDGTKIALFNIAIDIEDSDEIKNTNENKNDNVNININNSDKVEIRNKNVNNSPKKENIIKIYKNSIDDKISEEKQEKNAFIFVNNSFKGIEESEQKSKHENNHSNIINNNINNINDNVIVVENNEISNKNELNNLNNIHKKKTANFDKKKNNIKILKENNNIKAPINNIINKNLNKGKIIKITPNLNHKCNNSKNIKSDKILNTIKINFNKNEIHNMNIKEMFSRKNNLKHIKLNKNNINNYFLDTRPMNNNLSSDNSNRNDSLKTDKSGKSINSINKKSNYKRIVINYNKINIHNSNSTGKLALNKKLTIKTYNYQKLMNNNSAKQINSTLSRNNYQKMNLQSSVSPINTIENLNINSSLGLFKPNKIRLIKNKSQKNNERILKNQKLNHLIPPKNNILKLNLFSFNNGQFKYQFNNNIIKNLNYSINYVKSELDDYNKKQFNNNRNNNDLIITQYNDKRNRKFQYQKLKIINVNKNQKNNNSLHNNINLSYNNKKKLILPIDNYANNFMDYNKIDNTNYYNKTSYN